MSALTNSAGNPVGGVVPYPVTAIVTENVDPDEYGRIKVKFSTLDAEPLSYWLRQVSPNAGKERGLYALPEKEDEVLVIFMNGSQDIGVIIGQFWNGVDKPPTEAKDGLPGSGALWVGKTSTDTFTDGTTNLDLNDRRFWRSRSGHLIVMDDSDGAESVQIWDKGHNLAFIFDTAENRIVLANKEGDIHIRAKNDLFLEAGNDMKVKVGNNYDSNTGVNTTWIAGTDISTEATKGESAHTAKKDYKIEASMNVVIKATMDATVEGSMNFVGKGGIDAKLEGGATATVKGAMVNIN